MTDSERFHSAYSAINQAGAYVNFPADSPNTSIKLYARIDRHPVTNKDVRCIGHLTCKLDGGKPVRGNLTKLFEDETGDTLLPLRLVIDVPSGENPKVIYEGCVPEPIQEEAIDDMLGFIEGKFNSKPAIPAEPLTFS